MSRKRDKPYLSRHHAPYPLSKRRRPPPLSDDAVAYDRTDDSSSKSPATVVVMGLPQDCALLDIKSRFQIYGWISRTTMRHGGVAYVTFRSKESAEAAIAASVDPSFGIAIDSKRVQVMWANDPAPQWREAVSSKDSPNSSSSKLVRAEVPLSRRGRGNKLGSAIVKPNNSNSNSDSGLDVPFKGREIVAYDDIL
ncbi:RNA recognition motif domain protein [Actinidia chinensis var. chinensis]|uniref:RNA recognition motif domain protein n=1 Tax=Actinidia chinensis var. chinensis TaxID=1590841 RepID=A0A2R6QR12_ACTCC|nr:RNA recognition motif domain protein [Actinidia chinensis var. chinensis]